MYKKASIKKLRFVTSVGLVTVEQLWDLSMVQLAKAVRDAKALVVKNEDDELAFLSESKTKADTMEAEDNQLRFDILKDVYVTRKEAAEQAAERVKIRRHNQEIDELIAEKQKEHLKGLSIEELEKKRISD